MTLDILTHRVPLAVLPDHVQNDVRRCDGFVKDNITAEWGDFKYKPWMELQESSEYARPSSFTYIQFGFLADIQMPNDHDTESAIKTDIVATQERYLGRRGSPASEEASGSSIGLSGAQKQAKREVLAKEYRELVQQQERIQSCITLVNSFLEGL